MKTFIPYSKEVCHNTALKSIGYLLLFFIPAATGFSQSRSINTSALSGAIVYHHLSENFLPGITINPSPQAVCQGSTTSFTVAATGSGLTYAWQVSTNGGSTWTAITNNSQYSNATTTSLTVTGITAGMNNFQYRCMVSDNVPSSVPSSAATLTVSGSTAPTVWTTNQATPICLAAGTSALGAQPSTATSYQWQFSTDGGVTWSNTVDGATYSNSLSTNGNLFITLSTGLSGTLYHYIATAPNGCSATSAIDTLYVLQPVIAPPATASYVPVSGNTALTVC
ncbi:MAG TPA: hypothetical protein VLD19_05165, partial [Chitinophagaceae bacterium]|nr:hypothetical protein [Chitinophagaceae bacterium]